MITNYFTQIALESPALFYKFEEASGTLADSSGNSVDLDSFTAAPTYGVASVIPSQPETCIRMTEAGVTEFTSTANNPAALNGDTSYTMCWWGGGEGTHAAEPEIIQFSDYTLRLRNNGGDYFGMLHGATETASLWWASLNFRYTNGGWGQMYTLVHDAAANTYAVYINGKTISVNTGAYSVAGVSNDRVVTMGGPAGIDYIIQGLAIIPNTITPARILELFHSGVSGQTGAPIP